MIHFRSSDFKRYPLLIVCTSGLFQVDILESLSWTRLQTGKRLRLQLNCLYATLWMSLSFRVRAFDVKGLFVVVCGTWFSNLGFICSKIHKGKRSFGCRMAPLTELIILCLHTVCDHPEPKLAPRLSSPHLVGKSLTLAGGVLFCIFCFETIF